MPGLARKEKVQAEHKPDSEVCLVALPLFLSSLQLCLKSSSWGCLVVDEYDFLDKDGGFVVGWGDKLVI